MTNDDKALVDAMTLSIKESIGKQFNATPIHPDPSIGDWAASGGVIDLRNVAEALLPIISDRIEALSAENERLRQQLSGISGRLEAMRVALIHTAGICNPLGGFLKNVTGLRKKHLASVQDIARAALENSGD